MPLGTKADKISTHDELLKGSNTSGSGAPSHSPEVSTQTYVDIATGTVYEWWAGAWHAS